MCYIITGAVAVPQEFADVLALWVGRRRIKVSKGIRHASKKPARKAATKKATAKKTASGHR